MIRKYRMPIQNKGYTETVVIPQYDQGYMVLFEMTNLPEGTTSLEDKTVTLEGLRSDGLKYEYTGTITEVTASFEIDTRMTAAPGNGEARIVFKYASTGEVYAAPNFLTFVPKSPVPNDAIDADTEEARSIAEEIQEIVDTAAETVTQSVAAAYSPTKTYAVGDMVLYDNELYKCTSAIATPEAWTSGHWTRTTVAEEATELKSGFNNITNIDITTNGFVDTSGRVYAGDGTWKRSRYIQIDSINTLRCSFWAHRAVLNISFWTENFTFISGLGNTTRPEWGHASSRTYTLDPTDIPSSAVYVMYCTSTSNSDNYCTVTLKSREFDLVGKKYACLGDSITSDQVVGIGTLVNDILNTKLVGNFACGYATCSNWHTGDTDESPQTFVEPQNTNTADNVLMNQVLRLLQWTTASGEQVTWTHPVAGAYSVPTDVGTGLGHTDDIPDVIYIAIGVNDGRNAKNLFVDDSDAVMSSTYADLTKCSYASALRWAIETLNSAYPNAKIFVASPLFTNENDGTSNGHHNRGAIIAKREVSKKIANYCNAMFIDSTYESGYTVLAATQVGNIHPNGRYKSIIGRYVANEIKRRYVRG